MTTPGAMSSDAAERANIQIMRAFVRLRRASLVGSQLMALVEDLSKRGQRNRATSCCTIAGSGYSSAKQLMP
jgi:hypothetical protein